MSFAPILDAATELLQRRQRITYAALRRQFELDASTLHELAHELIHGRRLAVDENGVVLVWAGPPPTPERPARDVGERRQLTVMFCDLVDSTLLSNTLDVEALRVVLRRFQAASEEVIARHDGFINSYQGDGIVTLFGYPQAREDDARRAVRAALAVVAAVESLDGLPGGIRLRMRVGVSTGTVVVGELVASGGAAREESVVGSTPNLAAKLQALAQPGGVVVSAATLKLLGRRFDTLDLGLHAIPGIESPVSVHGVRGERPAEDVWSDGEVGAALPPLVDRELELPALLANWQAACAGQPRIVTLRGEAGLGKSRLCEAVREAVAAGEHRLLRLRCSTQYQNTALYPVIRLLKNAAALAEGDGPDLRLSKLRASLLRAQPADEVDATLPHVAALLNLDAIDLLPRILDSPERQRELTLGALVAQLLGHARHAPLLVIFEDLHWADPSTLALIRQLALQAGQTRLMLLATARPEFEPPWADLPRALTLELSLLQRHHRTSMVEHLCGGKALPPEILEHILQKSDGIPLYVEELTQALIESGLLRPESDRYVLGGPLRAGEVPSTLHDSLLARLDRLSSVKEVAQAGAAIGREFDHATLVAVLAMSAAELNAALARLTESGLVFCHGVPPAAVYTFKHALVQDTAYATMLRGRRQGLHARISEVLERQGRTAPELLAHHHTQAGQIDQAVPCLLAAGLRAAAGAAQDEACKHFEEGLRLTATLPDDDRRRGLELPLRLHLGMSLAATLGFAAPAVEACNQRARDLCRQLGDTEELFWVLRGLCALYVARSDTRQSNELTVQLLHLAERSQRPEHLIEAHLMLGCCRTYGGDFAEGRRALQRVVALYRAHEGRSIVWPTPQDPLMAALSLLALASWSVGDVAAAQREIREARQAAQATGRPFDVSYAETYAAAVANAANDFAEAAASAQVGLALCQRHGYAFLLAASAMQLGFAKASMGTAPAAAEGLALLERTLPAWRGAGAAITGGFFIAGLARALHHLGRHDEARRTIDEAIAHDEQVDQHYADAMLLCIRGELRPADDRAAARQDYRQAIAVARRQGAAMLELQAALALARCSPPGGEARTEAARCLRDALNAAALAADTREHREARAWLQAAQP